MSHEKNKRRILSFVSKRMSFFTIILFGLLMSLKVCSQLPTAQTVANQMKVGWNLGNTLDAICGENAWGNPTTSQTLINAVKAAGFNTVRIPCAWDCHTTNGVIDPNWLARVKAVVDYCISNQMYVIINIHWDGGWLENNVTTSAQSSVNAKQQNYWTQIANYFKTYDEHLLFASANEPNVSDNDSTAMSVLLSYHQTFINAVRATGGNNSSRTLIIQGPGTDITNTNKLMNTMPTDAIASRLMVEVHYYTPFLFTSLTADATWGTMFYYWGNGNHSTIEPSRNATWGEESDLDNLFGLMKTKFVDRGIPVLIGEFGAIKRANPADMAKHIASREYFDKYVVSSAISKGMVPVYWDNGATDFGIFNRSTGAVTEQGVINAIMQGYAMSAYVTLTNRATGLLIDGMYMYSNGSNAGQWSNSGAAAQQWSIQTVGSYVMLKNRASGLYIDGMYRSSNGSIAGQYSYSGSDAQYWTKEAAGSYVKFKNKATGLYLDGLGSNTNGADLGQWSQSSSNNQQWAIGSVGNGRVAALPDTLSAVQNSNRLLLYPNPFTSGLNMIIDDWEKVERVVIFDVLGKQVETIQHAAISNKMSMGASLHPGVYIVEVRGTNWLRSFKVVKMK